MALLMLRLWAALLLLPAAGAQAGVVLTTLHSFQNFTDDGLNPYAGLVQGSDGNFYGTTAYGGASYAGTVFKISTNGAETILHQFGGYNGANPDGLVQASDGNFYGTTPIDGKNHSGTVFKISANGAFTNLYSFSGGNDGGEPLGSLSQGGDGNFYGTTLSGGITNGGYAYGTAFKISPDGALTTLYTFGSITNAIGDPLDGANPQAGLVQGSDGDFYGTTETGGTNGDFDAFGQFHGYGTVFKISTNGALTTLYCFTGGNDGESPYAALVQGRDGNFYGTTAYGGGTFTNQYGDVTTGGTVFKITTNGVLTRLYSFTGGNDGEHPIWALAQGSDGYFYGSSGGFYSDPGAVFKINTNGMLTSLHSFASDSPSGLVQASDGNFYGATYGGGNYGSGCVFEISTNGDLSSLYSFGYIFNDGANPNAGLLQGSDGYFYGTTSNGDSNNFGTIFKISTDGAFTSLYFFSGQDGANPSDALMQGSDGYFYGTTLFGGRNNGTVFQISTNGVLTSLYSFTGGNDGAHPYAGLVQGSDGYFYGTTSFLTYIRGVFSGYGTVFKVSTNGLLSTLYSFPGGTNGTYPNELVRGSDGNFYGTTSGKYPITGKLIGYGTVFKINTAGALTTLHAFGLVTNASGDALDGANPSDALVQGSDGYYYGTTQFGGTNNAGTVFRISTNGALTTLYAFGSITNASGDALDGANPSAGLVQGSDGYLYGTTANGGTNNFGAVFQISTNGVLTSLYSFTGGTDGTNPQAGLLQGSDGSFYGTTQNGGQGGAGTVFRLTIVPPPQLTIIPYEPYVILTWPTDYVGFSYAGYTLQSTTNLGSSAVWTTVSPEPFVIGEENVVINTISGAHQFYRLIQ